MNSPTDIAHQCRNVDRALNGTALIILNAIWHGANTANPPTLRQLCKLTGCRSPNGVRCYLLKMRAMGLVTWLTGKETNERSKTKTLMPTCRLVPAEKLGKGIA